MCFTAYQANCPFLFLWTCGAWITKPTMRTVTAWGRLPLVVVVVVLMSHPYTTHYSWTSHDSVQVWAKHNTAMQNSTDWLNYRCDPNIITRRKKVSLFHHDEPGNAAMGIKNYFRLKTPTSAHHLLPSWSLPRDSLKCCPLFWFLFWCNFIGKNSY